MRKVLEKIRRATALDVEEISTSIKIADWVRKQMTANPRTGRSQTSGYLGGWNDACDFLADGIARGDYRKAPTTESQTDPPQAPPL